MDRVLRDIEAERRRQNALFGARSVGGHLDLQRSALVLMEEAGEAAQAVLALDEESEMLAQDHLREELVQVAAVAVAMVARLDKDSFGENVLPLETRETEQEIWAEVTEHCLSCPTCDLEGRQVSMCAVGNELLAEYTTAAVRSGRRSA